MSAFAAFIPGLSERVKNISKISMSPSKTAVSITVILLSSHSEVAEIVSTESLPFRRFL